MAIHNTHNTHIIHTRVGRETPSFRTVPWVKRGKAWERPPTRRVSLSPIRSPYRLHTHPYQTSGSTALSFIGCFPYQKIQGGPLFVTFFMHRLSFFHPKKPEPSGIKSIRSTEYTEYRVFLCAGCEGQKDRRTCVTPSWESVSGRHAQTSTVDSRHRVGSCKETEG